MAKIKLPHQRWLEHFGPGHEEYLFHCPGCKSEHRIIVKWGATSGKSQPEWSFNGNHAKPTFNPSLLIRWTKPITDEEHARIMAGEKIQPVQHVCHSFIRDGQIQFLTDCTHDLAGKTVDMQDVQE